MDAAPRLGPTVRYGIVGSGRFRIGIARVEFEVRKVIAAGCRFRLRRALLLLGHHVVEGDGLFAELVLQFPGREQRILVVTVFDE